MNELDPEHAGERLASNVRALRDGRGLSQAQVAKMAGVPRATWATVEAGGSNPTLAVLLKIAGVLGVSLEELVAPPRGTGRLVARSALKTRRRGGVTVTDLVPEPLPSTQMERMAFEPGATLRGRPHTAGTREYFCCERGQLSLVAGGQEWRLEEGDVVVFRGDQKHSYRNVGRGAAVAYSVVVLAPG
ncbi:MAG: helix-turn-helix domain-containing protein [Myxococcota bacterium]